MIDSKKKDDDKSNVVLKQLESVERLLLEKKHLMELSKQQTLVRDQRIQELEGQLAILLDNHNLLIDKLAEYDVKVIPELLIANGFMKERLREVEESLDMGTNRILSILSRHTNDSSFRSLDANELLEDFKKLQKAQEQSNVEYSYRSDANESSSRVFEIDRLEAALNTLEKVWNETVGALLTAQKDNEQLLEQVKLLKEQLRSSEEDQRRLRSQCNSLQSILNEAELSRSRISEGILNDIERATKNANIHLEKMTQEQLKSSLGLLAVKVEESKQKIDKLQKELYTAREQSTANLEAMTSSVGRVKEQKEVELKKKEKEIKELREQLEKR